MHTVRNRVASKPRTKGKMPTRGSRKKQEPAFMLKSGNPPAFPIGLIVPPPRGAMITAVPWPEMETPKPRGPAKPSPARKAAPRKSRKPKAATARKPRAAAPKAPVTAGQPLAKDVPARMVTQDLLERALAMKPIPVAELLPPTPVPQRSSVHPTLEEPLPRSQALSTTRGQGLFDVIGHWLRDAGNWLTRWNKGRRKDEDRARIARANAKHHALQSQFAALEALREAAKAD